ncbi:MAG: hypothetical protein ACP5NC_02045 [Nitrososphaeria archaeon]
MRTLIAEIPPHYVKSIDFSYKFIEIFSGLVNGFNLTDMPLNRVTVDNCAFVARINGSYSGRLISTVSVGHRDITANRSYMKGLSVLGIKQALLVQGPSHTSKVSQLLPFAVKEFNAVGTAISREDITRERINTGVKFFVTQMYPQEDDILKLGSLGYRGEVMVSVPAFEEVDVAKKLVSKGFKVPASVLSSSNPSSATRRILLDIMDLANGAGLSASAYIVPLQPGELQKWLEDLIKNM